MAMIEELNVAQQSSLNIAYLQLQETTDSIEKDLPTYRKLVTWLDEIINGPPSPSSLGASTSLKASSSSSSVVANSNNNPRPNSNSTPSADSSSTSSSPSSQSSIPPRLSSRASRSQAVSAATYLKYEKYRQTEDRLVGSFKDFDRTLKRLLSLQTSSPREQQILKGVKTAALQFIQESTQAFRVFQSKSATLSTDNLMKALEMVYEQKLKERSEQDVIRRIYVALAILQSECARFSTFSKFAAELHDAMPDIREEMSEVIRGLGQDPVPYLKEVDLEAKPRNGTPGLISSSITDGAPLLKRVLEIVEVLQADLEAKAKSQDTFLRARFHLTNLTQRLRGILSFSSSSSSRSPSFRT